MKILSRAMLLAFCTLAANVGASTAVPAGADPVDAPDLANYNGRDTCRIAPLLPVPRKRIQVDWRGACSSDGFASGDGELDWIDVAGKRYRLKGRLVRGVVQGEGELKTDAFTYIGTLRQGVPDGSGYFKYANGEQYEGEVAAGKRNGKGIMLWLDQGRYTGEWKNDAMAGWGERVYALGGSYSGQWQDDKWHGHGKLVYAGSGRVHEGQFENDAPAGSAPAAAGLADMNDQRTLAQQHEQRRADYKAIAPGDTPPYPAEGLGELAKAVHVLNHWADSAEGTLLLHVRVGADGKAKDVKAYEKPTLTDPAKVDAMVTHIANLLLLTPFQPGVCDGKPCEMIFPLRFAFSVVEVSDPRLYLQMMRKGR
jgi:hypothetical protein